VDLKRLAVAPTHISRWWGDHVASFTRRWPSPRFHPVAVVQQQTAWEFRCALQIV